MLIFTIEQSCELLMMCEAMKRLKLLTNALKTVMPHIITIFFFGTQIPIFLPRELAEASSKILLCIFYRCREVIFVVVVTGAAVTKYSPSIYHTCYPANPREFVILGWKLFSLHLLNRSWLKATKYSSPNSPWFDVI